MTLGTNQVCYILIGVFTLLTTTALGQQLHHLEQFELIDRQYINSSHTAIFDELQVQDFQGRIKPMQTLALELVRKIHGKHRYRYRDANGKGKALNATQVFLGMHYKPDSWQLLPLIKIEKGAIPTLSTFIEISDRGYAKPSQFFDFKGNYQLKNLVAAAFEKPQGKRTILDKDVIKIDERVNIVWGIFGGRFLKIFPNIAAKNNKWFAPKEHDTPFLHEAKILYDKIIPTYLQQLEIGSAKKDWAKANETIGILQQFQQHNASELVLSSKKVTWEIFYNKKHIFFNCMLGYTVIGIWLLITSFLTVFFNHSWIRYLNKAGLLLLFLIFSYHGFGIVLRWYISGHAPWSNGYEATVFIAWVGLLAGLLFSKRTTFPAAATALIAICLLGIAHGNLMSPEVTNLVPVLKSYWLMIHVAVITGSYGFLAMGSLLALLVLVCMLLSTPANKEKITAAINEMTRINERTTTIGLFMLTIGTFLGGVWANESWGRYWGWDPKETWALISIVIYAFVLHIRIIFPQKNIVIYTISSLFALGSLIMTFFGVNYYLSGLHSYAKGDSFPIPLWIYIVFPLLIGLSFMAQKRWRKL